MPENEKKILLAGVSVLVLVAAFLWSVRTVLSPLLVGGLLVALLSGLRGVPLMRNLRNGVLVLLLAWVLVNTQGIVVPFLVAFVAAYLINPMVDTIEKRRLPRLLGVALVFLGLGGVLTLVSLLVVPDLVREVQDLIVRLPGMIQSGIALANKHLPRLFELLKIDYAKVERDFLENTYPAKVEELLIALVKTLSGMGAWLSRLLNVILIPVLTFYFLKDYNKGKDSLLGFVPRRYKSLVCFYLWRANRIVGGYIRGQLIVCLIVGVLTWFGLFLFRNPYAVMIGIVTGILNIVPFVGLYVSLGVALMSAFFAPEPHLMAMKIAGVFVAVQSLEAYAISPKVVGDRVGLHPVAVIFSILIFSRFLGFWGLLIAVPAAALIKFFLNEWKRHQNWKDMLAEKIRSPKD